MKFKLIPFEGLETLNKCLSAENKRIVATNGCFDIIHPGHIACLETAKRLGDVLVVGINSDRAVKELKGKARPLNDQMTRAIMLSQLEPIDYVCIFDDVKACMFLDAIKPSVWAKGGDYTEDTIPQDELAIVKKNGGVARFIPFTFDLSTSKILSNVSASC